MRRCLVDGARRDDFRVGVVRVVRHRVAANDFDMNDIPYAHALEQRHHVLMRPSLKRKEEKKGTQGRN